MKKISRKGRKQAEQQPVDKVRDPFRDLVSSEEASQSSYAWGSQDDPYTIGLEDAPSQAFASQASAENHPHIRESCPPQSEGSKHGQVLAQSLLGTAGSVSDQAERSGPDSSGAVTASDALCCQPVKTGVGKRKATAQLTDSKRELAQDSKEARISAGAADHSSDWPSLGSVPGLLRPRGPHSGASSTLANALSDPAPATTVMEAQESGERLELQDSALYALDGLRPNCSAATQRDSAFALASLCASRRGRLALRADGLLGEVLEAALQLKVAADPVLALALSAILLAMAADKVKPPLFATAKASQLAAQLLQVPTRFSEEHSKSAVMASLTQMLTEGALAKELPPAEAHLSCSVVLHALASTTDMQHSGASDSLKAAIRAAGLLDQLCKLAFFSAPALKDAPGRPGRSQWVLLRALASLENASFASHANERHLAAMTLPHTPQQQQQHSATAGSQPQQLQRADKQPSGQKGQPFIAWLLGLVGSLLGLQQPAGTNGRGAHAAAAAAAGSAHDDREPQQQACLPAKASVQGQVLQSTLSVLMNVTHENPAGCRQVLQAQGADVGMAVVAASTPSAENCDRASLVAAVDLLSVALGLLINMAEDGNAAVRGSMADICAAPGRPAIALLCRLLVAAQPEAESPKGGEVTEASLAAREADGAAFIVALYASLLTGLLIEGSEERMEQARTVMPGGDLGPIARGVQQCLAFYLQAGAITPRTEGSLRRLAASLRPHLQPQL